MKAAPITAAERRQMKKRRLKDTSVAAAATAAAIAAANGTPNVHGSISTALNGATGGSVSKVKGKGIKSKVKKMSSLSSTAAVSIADESSQDSAVRARHAMERLIYPTTLDDFYSNYYEKAPLVVSRNDSSYFNSLFSKEQVETMIRDKSLIYGVDIDITAYENGQRRTLNPEGKAYSGMVWNFVRDGCSLRLLRPHMHSDTVWKLCSDLQEHFQSGMGVNAYLTPSEAQGFSPHYDDIEAFVIQVEGSKRWLLYESLDEREILPKYSSRNFEQSELGDPLLEVTLHPGDVLYFPRGMIHQAKSTDDEYSLHLTVSTCMQNTWGDLLERVLKRTLEAAFEEDIEYRRSLPRDYLDYMGIVHVGDDEHALEGGKRKMKTTDPRREAFDTRLRRLVRNLAHYVPVDGAADRMGVRFMHDSLPPVLVDSERKECMAGDQGDFLDVHSYSEVRFVRRHSVRLVIEGDIAVLYHCMENPRHFRHDSEEAISMELPLEAAPALEALIKAYPKYLRVSDLPSETSYDVDSDSGEDSELKEPLDVVELCTALYDRGLLAVK